MSSIPTPTPGPAALEQHSTGLGLLGVGLREGGRIIIPLVLSSGPSGRGSASLPPDSLGSAPVSTCNPRAGEVPSCGALLASSGAPPPAPRIRSGSLRGCHSRSLWQDAFRVCDPPKDLGQALDTPIALATSHSMLEVATGSLGLEAPSSILEGVSSPALKSRGCPPGRLLSPVLPVQAQPPGRAGEGRLPFPSGLSADGENQEARAHQGSGAGLGRRMKPLPAPLCKLAWNPRPWAGRSPQCGKGQCHRHSRTGCLLPRGFLASCPALLDPGTPTPHTRFPASPTQKQ